MLLKLYVTIDNLRQQMQRGLGAKHLPRDPRGGQPHLSAAEVVTMLVWGAWRGLSDKAQWYYHLGEQHRPEFPGLGSYSKFVEATNRYVMEVRGLLALILATTRQVHQPYPVVFSDSTALPVCKVARASQPRTFRPWARKAKTGSGWGDGFKVHVQCAEEGRLCAFDLTTAAVDDRRLL